MVRCIARSKYPSQAHSFHTLHRRLFTVESVVETDPIVWFRPRGLSCPGADQARKSQAMCQLQSLSLLWVASVWRFQVCDETDKQLPLGSSARVDLSWSPLPTMEYSKHSAVFSMNH
jgi:hypothetical protein